MAHVIYLGTPKDDAREGIIALDKDGAWEVAIFYSLEQVRALMQEAAISTAERAHYEPYLLTGIYQTEAIPAITRITGLTALIIATALSAYNALLSQKTGPLKPAPAETRRFKALTLPTKGGGQHDGILGVWDGDNHLYVFPSRVQGMELLRKHRRCLEGEEETYYRRLLEQSTLPTTSPRKVTHLKGNPAMFLNHVLELQETGSTEAVSALAQDLARREIRH